MGSLRSITSTYCLWMIHVLRSVSTFDLQPQVVNTVLPRRDNIFSHLLSIPIAVENTEFRRKSPNKFEESQHGYNYDSQRRDYNPLLVEAYPKYAELEPPPSPDFLIPPWDTQFSYRQSPTYELPLYQPYQPDLKYLPHPPRINLLTLPFKTPRRGASKGKKESVPSSQQTVIPSFRGYFGRSLTKATQEENKKAGQGRSDVEETSIENVLEAPTNMVPTDTALDVQERSRQQNVVSTKTDQAEYYYNPESPYFFVGAYPGTEGENDTLIVHKKPYTHDGVTPPTVQRFSSKAIFMDEDLTPFEVEKDFIIDFMSNFPKSDWCLPESNDGSVRKCCEEHQNCELLIESGDKRYGLSNRGLHVRKHCACEDVFFKCLKGNEDVVSNSLGVAYFNVLAPKCFAYEHKTKCLAKNKWKKCVKYGYDQRSRRKYQWLDTPTY